MTDQEILDKYIDLEKSCLTEKEEKEVWQCCISTKKHLVCNPHYSKRMQKLCGNGKFPEYVLPGTAKIIKTHI